MKKLNIFAVVLFFTCVSHAGGNFSTGSGTATSKHASTGAKRGLLSNEAFVNVPMIFEKSEMGKELHAEMVREARRFQEDLETKSKEIEFAKKELSKKASAMSADAVRTEEKKIAQLERDLSVHVKEKEEDFQMMAAKKEQAWAQEFQQVVVDWAQEFEFEKVWDEASGRPLYVADALKHTDKVIERMNKKSSDKKSGVEKSKDSSLKRV